MKKPTDISPSDPAMGSVIDVEVTVRRVGYKWSAGSRIIGGNTRASNKGINDDRAIAAKLRELADMLSPNSEITDAARHGVAIDNSETGRRSRESNG